MMTEFLQKLRPEDFDVIDRSGNRFRFSGNRWTSAEVNGGDLVPRWSEEPLEGAYSTSGTRPDIIFGTEQTFVETRV
jgi:hypothetical protein